MKVYEKKFDKKLKVRIGQQVNNIIFLDESSNEVEYQLYYEYNGIVVGDVQACFYSLLNKFDETEGEIYADCIIIEYLLDVKTFKIKFERYGKCFSVTCVNIDTGWIPDDLVDHSTWVLIEKSEGINSDYYNLGDKFYSISRDSILKVKEIYEKKEPKSKRDKFIYIDDYKEICKLEDMVKLSIIDEFRNNILPCPFCNNEPSFDVEKHPVSYGIEIRYKIRCCGIHTEFQTQDKMLSWWNKRI